MINDVRSGFTRVSAAAAHPIEFVVALTALTPLALHFCLHPRSPWMRRFSILALALILIVTPMSVSRSGLLTLAIALAVYSVTLTWRGRLNALVLALIGTAGMRAAVPGLVGTLRSLVFVGSGDPSIAGRTEDYAKIPALLDGHWVFGRGLGTFQPDVYFFLDNQYLGSLLEGGWILLGAVVMLLIVGMGVARGARKRSADPGIRSLGQALAAGLAGLAASGATFDKFSFNQTSYLMFLMVGCAAAIWTGVRRQDVAANPSGAPDKGPVPERSSRMSGTGAGSRVEFAYETWADAMSRQMSWSADRMVERLLVDDSIPSVLVSDPLRSHLGRIHGGRRRHLDAGFPQRPGRALVHPRRWRRKDHLDRAPGADAYRRLDRWLWRQASRRNLTGVLVTCHPVHAAVADRKRWTAWSATAGTTG